MAFNPDEYLASAPTQKPAPVPTVDPTQMLQFNPDEYLSAKTAADYDINQAKYGGLLQQALAGVEGTARGGSLGASDFLEKQLARVNPELFSAEAIAGRAAANPLTSAAGNMLGAGALLGATGGLAGPAEAALAARGVGPVAAKAIGSAIEGGVFGAGNVVSDMALGDPNLNAQKILSDIGMGSAIGGSLGILASALPAVPAILRKAVGKEATAEAVANPEGLAGLSEKAVVDVPDTAKPASSYAELQKQVNDLKKFGGDPDLFTLPQKPVVQEALPNINDALRVPINDMDLGSLESQEARDVYKTRMQMPGDAGQVLRDATVARKKDLLGAIDKQIGEISAGYVPATDSLTAGKRVTDALTDAIQTKRDSLGPLIGELKNTELPDENHLGGILDYLTNPESSPRANPNIAKMFDTEGDAVAIKPYNTAMGIDRATYGAVRQAVDALKTDPNDFETLFNIRKGLEQNVDVSKLGDAAKEVGNAKAAMMDYIQDKASDAIPELSNTGMSVRDLFKAYASNEEDANYIEKTLGAQVGSDNWRSLAKGKAEENILDKIFRDSKTVEATKRILGPKQFDQVLADYMSTLRADMTQEGVFSSNKFYSSMRRNQYGLGQAFSGHPEVYNKIQDYLTGLKTFVDHMPANPSGTAPTLMRSLMDAGWNIPKLAGNLKEYGGAKLEELRQAKEINAALKGEQEKAAKLGVIHGILTGVNDKITANAKAVFSNPLARGTLTSGLTYMSDQQYKKVVKQLKDVSANPEGTLTSLADQASHLNGTAPNITQALHSGVLTAINFLSSKAPQPTASYPLGPEWEPTSHQKMKFDRYFQAVNDPISILKKVREGTFTDEHMEALQAVHPQLLQDMQKAVLSHMDLAKAKKLPYVQRYSLAKFIGQPLDGNMTHQAIMANQMAFNGPQLSQQSAPKEGRKSPLGGLKQLNLAGRASSQTVRDRDNER